MQKVQLQNLHNSLIGSAKRYHVAEADLLEHIQRAEQAQVYTHRGFSSMFKYMTEEIGLSAANAYSFISVARKSNEIPELKEAIEQGELGVSKANKIVAVINKGHQSNWINKAKTLSSRKLEDEVIESNPDLKPKGYTKKLSKELTRVAIDLNQEEMELILKARDLLSTKSSKSVSNEEAFKFGLKELVEKHDPMEKAKRSRIRKEKTACSNKKQSPKKQISSENQNSSIKATSLFTGRVKLSSGHHNSRMPLKAESKHALNVRTGGCCTFVGDNGQKCGCKRHLHIHHIKPVAQGGGNELDNLTLLCSKHHRLVHSGGQFEFYKS